MNKIKTLLCATLLALTSISAMAKDYQAVAFGVKSDGVTNNTRSIQHAIDYISAQGGGRLVFYVGRYLTGSVELKSGVTLVIHEGAVLVASPSVYDHKGSPRRALIHAQGQHGIAITGKGIIDGNSHALSADIAEQTARGYADAKGETPTLIALNHCHGVQVSGVTLQNYACAPLHFDHCRNIRITGVTLGLADETFDLYEAKECDKFTAKDCLKQPRY